VISSNPQALLYAAVIGLGLGLIVFSPVRWFIGKCFPQQNSARPSREVLDSGYYKFRVVGEATNSTGHSMSVALKVSGHSDPGYSEVVSLTLYL
jgi:hypothetical protein